MKEKKTAGGNFLKIPENLCLEEEYFEALLKGRGSNFRIERIISHGHTTPPGEWYDQTSSEWVLLLQGEATLEFEDPGEEVKIGAGDWLFIAPHRRHRVISTTSNPPCIWLAIHGDLA